MEESLRLETLMESLRIGPDSNIDKNQMDLLAKAIQEKLGIQLSKNAYREMAATLVERFKKQSLDGNSPDGGSMSSSSSRPANPSPSNELNSPASLLSSFRRSTSHGEIHLSAAPVRDPTSTSRDASSSISQVSGTMGRLNLGDVGLPSTNNKNTNTMHVTQRRGRSPARNLRNSGTMGSNTHNVSPQRNSNAANNSTNSIATGRSAGGVLSSVAKSLRNRSLSPFGTFGYFQQKQPQQNQQRRPVIHEEKKADEFPSTNSNYGFVHQDSTISGNYNREGVPFGSNGSSSYNASGGTHSRGNSPYRRPGLQDDDDAGGAGRGQQSPARQNAVGPARSRTLSPALQRRTNNHEDESDSVRQPVKPRNFSRSPSRRSGDDIAGPATQQPPPSRPLQSYNQPEGPSSISAMLNTAKASHKKQLDDDPTLRDPSPRGTPIPTVALSAASPAAVTAEPWRAQPILNVETSSASGCPSDEMMETEPIFTPPPHSSHSIGVGGVSAFGAVSIETTALLKNRRVGVTPAEFANPTNTAGLESQGLPEAEFRLGVGGSMLRTKAKTKRHGPLMRASSTQVDPVLVANQASMPASGASSHLAAGVSSVASFTNGQPHELYKIPSASVPQCHSSPPGAVATPLADLSANDDKTAGSEIFSPMDYEPTIDEPLPCVFEIGRGDGGHSRKSTTRVSARSRAINPRSGSLLDPVSPSDSMKQKITASYSQESTANTTAVSTIPSTQTSPADSFHEPKVDYSGVTAMLAAHREEGKNCYMAGDYNASVAVYTRAIRIFFNYSAGFLGDCLAVLLSNRAAGLLMIGAYEASVNDCQHGLAHVSPAHPEVPFSSDSGLMLKIKLHTRMGRAMLKLGDHAAAAQAFDAAVKTSEEASAFSSRYHATDVHRHNLAILNQMATEAGLGKTDAKRLSEIFEKVSACTLKSLNNPKDKSTYAETLGHVNIALSIAPGSKVMSDNKLSLLTTMKRWREVAGYCERLAALNVRLDGVFVDDLDGSNPFPHVPPAQNLTLNFFGEARDEDATTSDLKLNSRAAAEAVMRLSVSHRHVYLRALRLEERYPAAEAVLAALEDYIAKTANRSDLQSQLLWLTTERTKLARTRGAREKGDDLFRQGDFDTASFHYAACLAVDGEGLGARLDGDDAGGRLHAVLHCNRAACLMAVRRFHEAVDECTKALRIHSRYMKAMLRRARCYMRLQRFEESISEYKRWLELVDEGKKSVITPSSFVTPCLFDGPRDVPEADTLQVKKELDEVFKAKRRKDVVDREEADRRRERASWQESFPSASTANPSNAQQRRDEWYNQQSTSRRWDSFANRGPRSGNASTNYTRSGSWSRKSETNNGNNNGNAAREGTSSHRRTHSGGTAGFGESGDSNSNHTNGSASGNGSPGSDLSLDHYRVLVVRPDANDDEIKKAYRKLALKYHPDKNKEKGAADIFRRIKLAYEVLNDPLARRQYDSERRLHQPF